MAHDFKKNQTVRYLGAGRSNSISTCYKKGDIVQIYSLVGDDTVCIKDEKKDIMQTCYIHQIEAIETTPKLPEKDSYICLLHDDTEVGTTLIRASQVDIMGDKMHISGNFILFNPNRFYFDTTGQYPLNIKFRLCTQGEKNWLDWCIGKNTFVELVEIPSKGNSLLIRPDHKRTITANFHSISDNCVNVDNIRIRGEVSQVLPSAQKTYKIRDCIRISESKLEEIHHSEPKMKVEKPTINVNGGLDVETIVRPHDHRVEGRWSEDPGVRDSGREKPSPFISDPLLDESKEGLVFKEKKDSPFVKIKRLLHLTKEEPLPIVSRIPKPIEVTSNPLEIKKGLIVPLEPIKRRIIK